MCCSRENATLVSQSLFGTILDTPFRMSRNPTDLSAFQGNALDTNLKDAHEIVNCPPN